MGFLLDLSQEFDVYLLHYFSYNKKKIIIIIVIIIITIYLSWCWAIYWPVPVSRIQKFLQRSATISSASWEIVFHYPGESIMRHSIYMLFRETCQWLKFPLNGLWAQSKASPWVGL